MTRPDDIRQGKYFMSQFLCRNLTDILSFAMVKQEWELRSENLHASFVNFHASVKRKQELHES
jgi:hypothetical protein